jgi:signal transduction histidine kinase
VSQWIHLLRSTIARVAALYTVVLALSMMALMAGIYFTTARLLDNQTNELINFDIQNLVEDYTGHNIDAFKAELTDHADNPEVQGAVYELRNHQGEFLAGNVVVLPDLNPDNQGWVEFMVSMVHANMEQTRRIRGRIVHLVDGYQLLVGYDIEDRYTFRWLILKTMAGSVAFTLFFGMIGGWWLGRRVKRTHQAITRNTNRILEGNLTERLAISGNHDEFDALVTTFNELIATIENLTLTLRSALDSTAHDLRGHLHRIQQSIEQLKLHLDTTTQSDLVDAALTEIERLNTTVEGLLRIALAESGTVQLEPVELSSLLSDLCEFYEPVAPQRLILQVPPHVQIRGFRPLLNQALSNLIDNAIKYSDGPIHIALSVTPLDVTLTVQDNGPGIPEAWTQLATQRFTRLPSSRGLPGSGLGLSLVAAVARLHAAELTLTNRHPGLLVCLTFSVPKPATHSA